MRVLFVCLGNICRSPTAEAVLRAKRPDLTIDSAGTGGWHVGEAPYGPMQAQAGQMGYDLSDLRARQFTQSDFDRFDLIIAMDPQNKVDIEALRPTGSHTLVRLMAEYGPSLPKDAVPDPYYTRDFAKTLSVIEIAMDAMIEDLSL